MAAQQSQERSSPSASSVFLPLGRRGSCTSLSTQAEQENLNAALNQIHNAAYQSDSLTVFNEFTNPPVPSAAPDEKSISGELQGGLSGLYSRFRGGVRDIVSGVGRQTDKAAEGSSVKSPASEHSDGKSAVDPTAESHYFHPNSSQGSRLHSPTSEQTQTQQDGSQQDGSSQLGPGKGSKLSSNAASISSKASASPSPAIKSAVVPLPRSAGSPAAVDPTVTEVNVNAVNPSGGNSPNLSAHNLQGTDSAATDKEDNLYPGSLSQSSSGIGQRLAHSPVLSAKTQGSLHNEGPNASNISRSSTTSRQLPDDYKKQGTAVPELDKAFPAPIQKHRQTMDGAQDSQERIRSDSATSFNRDGSNPSGSAANSVSQIPNSMNSSFHQTSSTHLTSLEGEIRTGEVSKMPAKEGSIDQDSMKSASRFAHQAPPRSPSTETISKASAMAPLDTEFDRTPSRGSRNRNPQASDGDGVMSQLRSNLLSKEFWMRDENAKDCFHCGEPFSTFRRKHHCRTCGQIFDSKCTLLIPGAQFGQPGSIRVCKPCEAMINAHDDDSSEFSDSDQSPMAVNPRVSELSLGSAPRMSNDDDDTSSVVSQSVDSVMKTPTMAIPATRRAGDGHNRGSTVLEISPDRPLARPTSSKSLRSSLSGRHHSMGHKRHHSRQQYIRNFKPNHDDRAPFQRRHGEDVDTESRLPAFHKDNIIDPDLAQYLSDDASSGDEQPNLLSAVSESPLSKSGGDNEKTGLGGLFNIMKKGRSALGDRSTICRDVDDGSVASSKAANVPRPRRRNLSIASSVRQSPRASRDSVFNPHDIPSSGAAFPAGMASTGFKMTRSSSMRGAGAPPVEMNQASLQHVRKLLRQLLNDASVPHVQGWETALLPILLKAADEVDPDVQRGDDMDIRHYIKLKKILGGRPGDTSYVSGLVFRKNVALKSMPRSIPNPNILIITFPLEYARHQQHFMSLEPVIRQEREFLENLVSRIAALKPNLLLAEKNVSGLALELLEKLNITTAYNVKSSVLEAVSRCTHTRIITSMDKLVTTPMQSECSSFDIKTYVYHGRKKTYMYISGCPKELGCTIVLRGGDKAVLAKVKSITEFMIYVVYNLKLETCLMRDEFAKIPTSSEVESSRGENALQSSAPSLTSRTGDTATPGPQQESNEKREEPSQEKKVTVTNEETEVPDDVPMPTYYEDMVQDHERKLLSASPFVKFEPPYLLMRAREMERRLAYLKRLRDQDVDSDSSIDEKAKGQKFVLITPEMVHESPQNAPPKVKEVLRAAHDAEYDRALHHYITQKRHWETYVSGSNSNLFDPYAHQNIVILFSLVCTTTSIPCSGPDSFALEYYNEHGDDTVYEPDCTLGQYVEDLCASANGICTANGCERRMFEHHRQYVHGEAQISVFIQPYPSKLRGLQDTILMWSCCKICGNETQVFPMSDNTWKYSFGKYLELCFWSKNLHARAGVCPHDLQRDHLRYFGFKDMAVRIHYDKINLLEIIVPRTRVTWKVDNDLRLRNEVYVRMEQRLTRFMVSVKTRLKGINVQSVVPARIEECRKEIELLNRKANEDQAALIRQLQDKYINSRYWELIPLNEVLRSVQEKVVGWDTAFSEFEKNFFPSEKDIRRLATLQLKKIFKDASMASFAPSEEPATTPAETENEANKEAGRPLMMRRMTLSPEKAQDVLVSVVEEHTGKNQENEKEEVEPPKGEVDPSTPSITQEPGRLSCSPQEAVAQKEVRHLDLAVPSSQTEQHTAKPDVPASTTDTHEPAPGPDDSEKQPAKIPQQPTEPQTDSQQQDAPDSPEKRLPTTPTQLPSAIPRLAEAAFRRSGKTRSPPLHRAQSQPAHLQKDRSRNTNKLGGVTSNILEETPSPPQDAKSKGSDKKLTERLGLAALKNGRLPSGHSFIPRSVPNRKKNTRVSNLAKHFEQMTREFEKERQRERQRRAAKGTHSRAYPLASSKPIVEVYKNVREAVEEREPSGEGEDFMSPASRKPLDDSSRTSEEFQKRVSDEEPRKEPPPQQPAEEPAGSAERTEPPEPEDNTRADEAVASEAEAEDAHSDEDRMSTDGLQIADSHEEIPKMSPEDEQIDPMDLKNHERSTLLKLLTTFWSERSASGWAPLEYPLTMSDHVFADCDIIVREDEPSSLIAFALDSSDYNEKLASIRRRNEEEEPSAGHDPESKIENRLEKALLRDTGTHLKYQFQEGQAKMLCKVFYAEQFDALRKKCGVADRIVESLSRCAKWDSKGGKTKSIFLKTLDNRFILKSLAPIETQAFLKFAPGYFQIMSEALFHELPSAIAKMFGFYQVIIKNPATGVEFNWFLLLMENLFYDRVPQRIFDLKGSMRNRKVESTGERNEVLLDENMVDFIYETPLFTREHSKKLLSQSVWNDTLFLARQNVMDYSLMIAIDESRSELVVGVIDCIRTYTWDKKLESWIKDRGFAGGGKNRPTVTSPKEYKSRFREAMARYVLQAPRLVSCHLLLL